MCRSCQKNRHPLRMLLCSRQQPWNSIPVHHHEMGKVHGPYASCLCTNGEHVTRGQASVDKGVLSACSVHELPTPFYIMWQVKDHKQLTWTQWGSMDTKKWLVIGCFHLVHPGTLYSSYHTINTQHTSPSWDEQVKKAKFLKEEGTVFCPFWLKEECIQCIFLEEFKSL